MSDKRTMAEFKVTSISYEESRTKYFQERMKTLEGKLEWWCNQERYKRFSGRRIDRECSELGAEISYLRDAMNALMDKSCIVHCSECKHWNTEECPMCYEKEFYDDEDGYVYRIYNQADYDTGFCDSGERFGVLE